VNQEAVAAFQHRVRADEPVVVIDRRGRTHEGAFRGSSATSISIAANGQTEDMRYDDVGRVERKGDSVGNGAVLGVIGGAPYWVIAAAFACEDRPGCAVGAGLALATSFAALGAYIDSRHIGRTAIYGPPKQTKVGNLPDLWMSLSNGDTVTVTHQGGNSKTTGVFQGVANGAITVLVGSQIQTFPEAEVRKVARRGDSLRNGTWIGATFGAISFAAPCESSSGRDCGSVGSRLALGAVGAVVWGAGGALIDSLIVGHTTVYESSTKRTSIRITPQIGLGRRGALVAIGF